MNAQFGCCSRDSQIAIERIQISNFELQLPQMFGRSAMLNSSKWVARPNDMYCRKCAFPLSEQISFYPILYVSESMNIKRNSLYKN